jgi:hypothetical protein
MIAPKMPNARMNRWDSFANVKLDLWMLEKDPGEIV